MRFSDQTRRLITLLIFFLLGPLLTLGILAGIGLRRLPYNARLFERNLSIQTGLDWNIEAVDYRSPENIRLKKVRLIDPSLDKPLYFAPQIDLIYVSSVLREDCFPDIESSAETAETVGLSVAGSAQKVAANAQKILSGGKRPKGFWRISIPESSLRLNIANQAGASQLVGEHFNRILSRFSNLSGEPIQIVLDKVEIFLPNRESTGNQLNQTNGGAGRAKNTNDSFFVRFIAGNVYRTPKTIRSDWFFQMPAVSETEKQAVSIEQDRKSGVFRLTLKTEEQPISCELASLFCPAFQSFGPGSRFSGEISGQYRPGLSQGWNIRLRNAFLNDLDLARFASAYTPAAVSGNVQLSIASANFGDGPFEAQGWIWVRGGSLERSLFHRLVDRFALQVNPEGLVDAPLEDYPFDDCMINFRLQADGIVFWSGDSRNVFMTRNGDGMKKHSMAVFFTQRNMQPISYHSILSLFAPDSAPIVPLTPGIQKLVSIIPTDSFTPGTNLQRQSIPQFRPQSETPSASPRMFANSVNTEPHGISGNTPVDMSNNTDILIRNLQQVSPQSVSAESALPIAAPWTPTPQTPAVPHQTPSSLFRDRPQQPY